MGHISPVRDSLIQSFFEETGNLEGNVETSIIDTTINHGEQPKQSTLEQTTVILPKVLNTESFHEEFKILNRKLNSLLKLQVDGGDKNSISTLNVDLMLQAQEHRILDKLNHMEEPADLRIKSQLDSFHSVIRELKETTKSCHILFVQDVTVRENVNLKVQE
ncbi:unnamed protein product [Lactuca saligna]|uniref:Uncharacterized protein n=1 Tax=Lactuca saligna TaxID=75948 RepID=A0AA36E5T2_LACSI|nr:unnamed protein product [Lactuca saligna]